MRAVFAALLCFALPSPVLAATDWELVRDARARDDVRTWVRPVPGNPLKAFKGQVEVPLPMLNVMAVLADTKRFPDWVFQCDDAYLLPERGPEYAYIHIAGIWPVDDRDIPIRNTIVQDPQTLAITLTSTAEPKLVPEVSGTVRVPDLHNTFLIEPLNDGWTRITFQTFVDPGGFIPSWLANLVAIRAPRDTLEGLYKLAKQPDYQLANADQLPDTQPAMRALMYPEQPLTPATPEQ